MARIRGQPANLASITQRSIIELWPLRAVAGMKRRGPITAPCSSRSQAGTSKRRSTAFAVSRTPPFEVSLDRTVSTVGRSTVARSRGSSRAALKSEARRASAITKETMTAEHDGANFLPGMHKTESTRGCSEDSAYAVRHCGRQATRLTAADQGSAAKNSRPGVRSRTRRSSMPPRCPVPPSADDSASNKVGMTAQSKA